MQAIKDHYKNLIIGFGKGGKTLAAYLAGRGEEVAIVEKSKGMYGGTCINIACIPTKSLIVNAEKGLPYPEAHTIKDQLTATLRQKNYDKIANAPQATVIDGTASFASASSVTVKTEDEEKTITAERIFINTGTKPFVPGIDGVYGPHIYNSTTLMELGEKPRRLVVIGGGFVGLEFADMFLKFGSEVTVLDHSAAFLPREDRDMAEAISGALTQKGLKIVSSISVNGFVQTAGGVKIQYSSKDAPHECSADAVLMATGREPETQALNLEAAGIRTDKKGYIVVNDRLETTAPNVWAVGDVNGGPQFTYISLDDFRIIRNQLSGGSYTSTGQRKAFATSVFITPPYARVGINETEAREKGLAYQVFSLPAQNIPKAAILRQKEGLLKAIVEKDTGRILGCMLFCAEAHEIINIVQLAVNAGIPYQTLRDAIYTHPTMAEGLNDLFA